MIRRFNYSFLKDKVNSNVLALLSIIYDIKGKESCRLLSSPSLYNSLKKKAIRDSIKASNAIENIRTTEKRITDISNGDNVANSHSEKEIIGYRDVLNNIHNYHEIIHFDEITILSLHKDLLNTANIAGRGEYKKEPNVITEKRGNKNVVVFTPTHPKDVKESINQLLLAYGQAIRDPEIHPLLLIPCCIVDFLCIHPFDDGNGRMSRLLTLLLLYKSGFDIGKYISIEKIINDSKEDYYDALHRSSIGWHENKNDYSYFILYMMRVIYRSYKLLDENVFSQLDKKLNKKERIEQILMNTYVPLSKQEIMEQLPDISENMIELIISNLIEAGKIIKIGSYKDAKYYRK